MTNMEELLKENQGLVRKVIRDCYPQLIGSSNYEDAFQEGCIGLLKAFKKFDPARGFKFSTYAYPIIRTTIYKSIYKSDCALNISKNAHALYITYRYRENKGETFEKIAKGLNVTEDKLRTVIESMSTVSLDGKVQGANAEGEPHPLSDLIADESPLTEDIVEINEETRFMMFLCENFLRSDDWITMQNTFNEVTQYEIAKILKTTQASVSRRSRYVVKEVFPIFRGYYLDEIPFGEFLMDLSRYNKKINLYIKQYINYALDCALHENNGRFLEEFDLCLNEANRLDLFKVIRSLDRDDKVIQRKLTPLIKLILSLIDKYYNVRGIEKIIVSMTPTACSDKNKGHLDRIVEWAKTNPNKLIKTKEILKDLKANEVENDIKYLDNSRALMLKAVT